MPTKIAVIGECMIELSESKAGIVRHFGGDTLNTAIYLTRTNPELAVSYVTALGTDTMSDAMLTQWQQEGVHTELVQRLEHKLPGLISSKPMPGASAPSITGAMMPPPATGCRAKTPGQSANSCSTLTGSI